MDSFSRYIPTNVIFNRELDDSVIQNRFAFKGFQVVIRPFRGDTYRLCTNQSNFSHPVFQPLSDLFDKAYKDGVLPSTVEYSALSDGWFAFSPMPLSCCKSFFAVLIASIVGFFYGDVN